MRYKALLAIKKKKLQMLEVADIPIIASAHFRPLSNLLSTILVALDLEIVLSVSSVEESNLSTLSLCYGDNFRGCYTMKPAYSRILDG